MPDDLPEEAHPQRPIGKQQRNYRIKHPLGTIEVQLQNRVFRLIQKKDSGESLIKRMADGNSPVFNWPHLGGIQAAWEMAVLALSSYEPSL